MSRATLDAAIPPEVGTRDPRLAEAIAACGPIEIPGRPATLHALCVAVIGQQLSMTSAAAIAGRFTARFGEGEAMDAAALAAAPEEELRALGLSRGKARTVREAAAFWQAENLSPERLAAMGNDEVIACLTQVRGIGPWTAKMVLIFSLRRADVLPHEDLGLRMGMKGLYRLREVPDRARIERIAERWRPHRTVGTWYCWRWLEEMRRRGGR